MNKPLFVTGIGTGIGKTVTAAILTEKLKADYWKPIQSGDLDDSDTLKVKSLISNPKTVFHPETYRLTQPFSPHKSAHLDGVEISLDAFVLPKTENHLIIEGAGGLMVPLNDNDLIIDLIQKLDADVILVSQNYLGSINHTLLSIAALKSRGINVRYLVMNGARDAYSESAILKHCKLTEMIYIPQLTTLSKEAVLNAADQIVL